MPVFFFVNRKPLMDQSMFSQTIINAVLSGFGFILAFFLRVVWDGLRELQKEDMKINAEVAAVKLLMADSYIKKEDFERLTKTLFSKLDRIEDKLDHKADK